MKKLKNFFMVMAAIAMIMPFNSCGDDDEPDGGKKGEATVTIDGESINLKYAYYTVSEGYVMIQFSSHDLMNGQFPESCTYVLIDYPVSQSQTDIENATVSSGVYTFSIEEHDGPEESGNSVFYESRVNAASNSDLVVEKNGKNIKLSIDHITLEKTTSNGKPLGEISGSFHYNGSIKKLSY